MQHAVIVTFLVWVHSGKVGVQQRRSRSRAILCMIFESSSLARVSCFLMFLWVLKATVGLFRKGLESYGDFSMSASVY